MRAARIVLALVCLAGCTTHAHASGPLPATTTTGPPACVAEVDPGLHTMTWQGRPRTYRVLLPRSSPHKHPLIVALHGFASTSAQFDHETGIDKQGTARGYVVVTPDASGSPTNWNIFSVKGQPDDAGFVNALVAALVPKACVDPARIYAVGHSAGSAFAGFLVCKPPYRYAAVAMVEATVPSTCPPAVTPAVVSIHATGDPVVLYNGGLGLGQTVPIPPVRDTVAAFARGHHCAAMPVDTKVGPFVTRRAYAHCAHGDPVELYTIEGGGHLWTPGDTSTVLDFFDRLSIP